MAGVMLASAALKEAITRIKSFAGEEIALLWNFKDDLQHMQDTLIMLQAVLKDAELQSYSSHAVLLWLKKLKDAAYDIEDTLNDFSINRRIGFNDDIQSKVRRIFSLSNPLITTETIIHRMKEMRKRLDKIAKLKNNYQFKVEDPNTEMQAVIKHRETNSSVGEKASIYGRDEEKELIVKMLFSKSNKEEIAVIPIVGIGGLGKTTLAKLVFNDQKVKQKFELKIWVYVSMKFDFIQVGQCIIESVTKQECRIGRSELMKHELESRLSGKRFLIVFDDCWNEGEDQLEKWGELQQILSCGSRESKIIVTTRSSSLAMKISTVQPYHLKYLSESDCWQLLKTTAFKTEDEERRHWNLEGIGRQISRKCGGVPLAVRSLAGLLQSKMTEKYWSYVRDNQIWELHNADEKHLKVMSSLKLTYSCMPSELKLCFSYCSIFPKGLDIDATKLVKHWAALGLIRSTGGSLGAVETGNQYLERLLSLSFLQEYRWNKKTRKLVCRMHDLVHDLAKLVAGDEVLIVNARYDMHIEDAAWRYATLIGYKELSSKMYTKLKRVRALRLGGSSLSELSRQIFSWLPSLRVLDLSGCFDMEELPNSLNKLQQLRYINASDIGIDKFPHLGMNLPYLEFLNLLNSRLKIIPESITSLRSLYSLNLSGSSFIQTLPATIDKLQNLQYLDISGFAVGTLPESIGNLQRMHSLNLSYCELLQNLPESIGNLQILYSLNLSHCPRLVNLPESVGILQSLLSLDLSHCSHLRNIPESIGNLHKLNSLSLSSCSQLQRLPSAIGNLKYLQNLDLSSCELLLKLPESIGSLKSLYCLNLSYCLRLEKLPKSIRNLHNLHSLKLAHCTGLDNLFESVSNLKNLHSLNLCHCFLRQILNLFYSFDQPIRNIVLYLNLITFTNVIISYLPIKKKITSLLINVIVSILLYYLFVFVRDLLKQSSHPKYMHDLVKSCKHDIGWNLRLWLSLRSSIIVEKCACCANEK